MSQTSDDPYQLKHRDALLPEIVNGDLAARVCSLERGERLTLVGISRDEAGKAVRTSPAGRRGALLIESGESCDPEAILGRLLDDLSEIALERWPWWYGRSKETSHGMVEYATADSLVSAPWVRAAARRAAAGYRPRFRKVAKGIEFVQLMHAIDPLDPILIAPVDPVAPARAMSMIQVLEWCAGHGASVVATLAARPPLATPYDRILYEALEVIRDAEPARARFIPPRRRAHHASTIEQRMEAALQSDAELGPLFSYNETVSIRGFDSPPRVDLLWREGRVVVELDGPDHQENPKFANDRHRDYELLLAGYLVLRITNDQVETDLQRAVEKIRAVVRFRQSKKEVQS